MFCSSSCTQLATATLALLGFGVTLLNTQRKEQLKQGIARVSEQLRCFYGPLQATISATQTSYNAMVQSVSPDGTAKGLRALIDADPMCEAASEFRLWVETVLMPLNLQALQVIITRADLLDAPYMPRELRQFVAQ